MRTCGCDLAEGGDFHERGSVAPRGRLSRAITLACLEPARIMRWPDARADWRDFADPAGGADSGHVIVQAAEQVPPTAMTRYMLSGHP